MKNLLTLILFFCGGSLLYAQEVSITLTVDKDTVMQGDFVRIVYQIENASADIEHLEFPGLQIVSGPNNSFNMQIINGEMTQSKTYEIIGRPLEVGVLEIPAGRIEVDGMSYMSESLNVYIVENPSFDPSTNPGLYREKSFRTPNRPDPPKTPAKPKKKMKTIRI